MFLRVLRNEIQYHDENIPGYRGVVEPQLVKTGIVTPIYYHDVFSPDGVLKSSPDFPELASFTQVYTQIFGKAPSGIKYEALKAANIASGNMGRVAMMPPGTPPQAVTALRQAFAALSKDEEFIADAVSGTERTLLHSRRFEASLLGVGRSERRDLRFRPWHPRSRAQLGILHHYNRQSRIPP